MSKLEQAEQALDDFLVKHPELASFQRQIDDQFFGITDPLERLQILMKMMSDNVDRLHILAGELHEKPHTN